LKKAGIDELNFTEILSELNGLYLKTVFDDIIKIHKNPFQGRTQLVWRGAGSFFQFHVDKHTPNRYHVPIVTNDKCYWMFRDNEKKIRLDMPADGKVWYLNPTQVQHTFINESNTSRLHLLMTSSI
jgi:hypothetical protein